LSGPAESLREALAFLRQKPGLSGLETKESITEVSPYRRLRIKIKPEIVTFKIPECSPLHRHAPYLRPEELDRWYSEQRKFLILDTRNEYEFRLGTFAGAKSLNIDHFVDFAEAVKELRAEWKDKPVVTFCTGGIRCEKAAPYMASLGFEQVYQVEGGILNYFAKTPGTNWVGECFVFDDRVAVGPNLRETGARLCAHCQGPIPAAEKHCIHCGR
jgi:UPF0176 protein